MITENTLIQNQPKQRAPAVLNFQNQSAESSNNGNNSICFHEEPGPESIRPRREKKKSPSMESEEVEEKESKWEGSSLRVKKNEEETGKGKMIVEKIRGGRSEMGQEEKENEDYGENGEARKYFLEDEVQKEGNDGGRNKREDSVETDEMAKSPEPKEASEFFCGCGKKTKPDEIALRFIQLKNGNQKIQKEIEVLEEKITMKSSGIESIGCQLQVLSAEFERDQETMKDFKKRAKAKLCEMILSAEEKKRASFRKKLNEKKFRIGEFFFSRDGSRTNEVWVDGPELKELKEELEELKRNKMEWEKKRKTVQGAKTNGEKTTSSPIKISLFFGNKETSGKQVNESKEQQWAHIAAFQKVKRRNHAKLILRFLGNSKRRFCWRKSKNWKGKNRF